jgi:hypothetical protein
MKMIRLSDHTSVSTRKYSLQLEKILLLPLHIFMWMMKLGTTNEPRSVYQKSRKIKHINGFKPIRFGIDVTMITNQVDRFACFSAGSVIQQRSGNG